MTGIQHLKTDFTLGLAQVEEFTLFDEFAGCNFTLCRFGYGVVFGIHCIILDTGHFGYVSVLTRVEFDPGIFCHTLYQFCHSVVFLTRVEFDPGIFCHSVKLYCEFCEFCQFCQ